jgi:SPP1 family predicted phage head-tail adaptor
MGAGDRNYRVVFQRATTIDDDLGQPIETWADYVVTTARVRFGTAQEQRQAAQESASQTATFECLRTSKVASVTLLDRIIFDGSYWDLAGRAPLDRQTVSFTAIRSLEGAGVITAPTPPDAIADLNFAAGSYTAAGVSYGYDDILDPYMNAAGVVAGEGLRITIPQASASDSVFSTPEFFAPIGATHTGVIDLAVQYPAGELAVLVSASNFSNVDGRAMGAGAEFWSGQPGTFDGFYVEDKNNIEPAVRAPVKTPLTVGEHRVAYSLSQALVMISVDGGPVVSYIPALHTDFAVFDRFNFYVWRNGLTAVPTNRRTRFYPHVTDPALLQQMSAP